MLRKWLPQSTPVMRLLVAATAALASTGYAQTSTWQMGKPIVTGWLLGYSDGGTFTDARANYAVDGGYNLVWVTSQADLNVAQEHGLRAMYLSPSVLDPSMVGTPALNSLITQVSAHPAFYSYFVGDEPSNSAFAGLGSLVNYIRGRDPSHLSYVNVLPLGAFNWASNPVAQYQTYLNDYMSTVQPSMLSYDNYEFMSPTTSQYLQNLSMISQSARSANIPFMNIVPATAVGTAPTPNSSQLRFLVYSTLAYGGTGIHYWFGGQGSNPTTATYSALTPLNKEFVAVGEQLQGLHAIGTYLKGYQTIANRRPPGTVTLPANAAFQIDVSDTVQYNNGDALKGVLLGLFDADGPAVTNATFAMVQNIDSLLSRTATITGPGNLSIFDATAKLWSPTGSTQATLALLPGGGKLIGLTLAIPGGNATWTKQSGDWNSTLNWSGGIPNGIDATANFTGSITAARSVFADIATTVGTLNFNNTNRYVIGGAGSLSLQTVGTSAAINVTSGSHKISLPLTFVSNTIINVANGSTLTIANPATIKANKTVTKIGNLVIQAPLTIESGGALVLGAGGATLSSAPSIGSGASVDVRDGVLKIDYLGQPSPVPNILAQLTSGFNNSEWNGQGINTSTSSETIGLGWVDDIGSESIQIVRAYYGDANLSGSVDSMDFAALSSAFGKTNGSIWAEGDFNYDGKINTTDFNHLAGNFGLTLSASSSAETLGSVVPEPAGMSLMIIGIAALRTRKLSRI